MRKWLAIGLSRSAFPVFFALLVVVTMGISLVPPVSAVAQGDGTIVYGEGAVATPRNRTWTQATTSWGAEGSNPTAAATIRHVVTKASPTREEIITGIQTTGGALYIQRWNGNSWSAEWNVTVGNGNLPRFDIAYERNSGEALIVYSRNAGTTNELQYRRWDGSSWTGATNLDAVRTSGVVQAVQLQAGGSSDDIALAWGDANLDLSANYWNGSANSWAGEPASALSTGLAVVGTATALTTWSFDVAIESISGDVLVVWGNNAVLDVHYVARGAGAGGSWGNATTNTAAFEEPTDLELSADPDSDYIAYANTSDNGGDGDVSTWTGTAWNSFNNFDTALDSVTAGTNNISVGWVTSGAQSRAVVTYDDVNAAGVDWLYYNKNANTWSGLQADFTTAPAPAGANDRLHRLRTNPFNPGELMLLIVDNNSDLFAKRLTFDGTNFTWLSSEPGGAALELTTSSITGSSADFSYARFVPGTLTVDIVDSGGSSVASPNVDMSGTNVSLNCQAITGTFGTPSQKIRINNDTATPSWTLTVAATGGNTSIWSSGGTQYDYNDSSGSPPGCSDGGDADAHAGQLGMNPSAGTLTPESGCTNTGVSLGSSAAFVQTTLDSLTLATASSSATTSCYWDITGIAVSQQLPAEKPAGSYTINLTLTATSN